MTHFSLSAGSCRVDRFKPSGKWYDTFTIHMEGHYHTPDLFQAIRDCITRQGITIHPEWRYVVLNPYHVHSHPVMIKG